MVGLTSNKRGASRNSLIKILGKKFLNERFSPTFTIFFLVCGILPFLRFLESFKFLCYEIKVVINLSMGKGPNKEKTSSVIYGCPTMKLIFSLAEWGMIVV